jgi:hypothetical protein
MKRAEYERWKASYRPTHESRDPALDALFSGKQVIACDRELSPRILIDKSDPREEVVDALKVESIDAGACRVVLASTAPPAKTGERAVAPTAPVTTSSPSAPSAAPKPRGCGGCEASAGASGFGAWPTLVLGLLSWRRRRATRATAALPRASHR